MELKLFNSMGRRKEAFRSAEPGIARIYHCGPTVKDAIHIGKFRSYILADVLRRSLEYCDFSVRQVMNITDVGHLNEFEEDIVEIAASRTGLFAWELAEKEERIFHEDRHALAILDAHEYPKARENIETMIEFIALLEKAGAAYRAGGNVYLDISRVKRFGKLAGASLAELVERQQSSQTRASAGKGASNKRHPLDIDLWRTDADHQQAWDSPWGRGFPGWHVECAAMSRKYLGASFDVHTGSADNLYPHHECEIAQVETITGEPLARYWLHSGAVTVDGYEMSVANDNIVSVRELIESGFRGAVVRLSLLSRHYREALDFGDAALDWARDAVHLILGFREHLRECGDDASGAKEAPRAWITETTASFEAAVADDLDLTSAVDAITATLQRIEPEDVGDPRTALAALERWNRILGVF